MQSSIRTFFQATTTNKAQSVRPAPALQTTKDILKEKSNYERIVIDLSDEGQDAPIQPPPAVQKRRKLTLPRDGARDAHVIEKRQAKIGCQTTSDAARKLSEHIITNYIAGHGRLLKDAIHSLSLDQLQTMLIDTLISAKTPNQLWTKLFENRRCVNLDVNDLIASWMRAFLRRRPLDINDDEVALLESYRIRSAAERKRDSQFIVDDSDDDEIPLCRVLVLQGPTGSGKTSAVHSCLYVLNENKNGVIEINASQRRRQADLVNRFKEATQSQWIGEKPSESRPKSGTRKLVKGKNSRKPGSGSDKHAVILIDDVDVSLEDDTGFSKGVAFLLKDTRRPIILTCAGLPDSIRSLLSNGYYNLLLCDSDQKSVISFLLSIAISKGAVALPSESDLKRCLNLLHNDLRSTINQLQFWLDTDRESLIENLQNGSTLSCLNTPSINLYQRVAGFGNLSLESLWEYSEYSSLQSVIRHGIESDLCCVIHENYMTILSESDNDQKNLQSFLNIADVSDSLSIADLISTYRDPKQELSLHSRLICCTSGLLSEQYKGFLCNSSRKIDSSECNLHSALSRLDQSQTILSLWEEHQCSAPLPKHHPSCMSFALDNISLIRTVSRNEEARNSGSTRRTRRFQRYLRNTLSPKGIDILENYCTNNLFPKELFNGQDTVCV